MYYIMLQCFNYVKVKQMSSALLKLVIPIDISKRTLLYALFFDILPTGFTFILRNLTVYEFLSNIHKFKVCLEDTHLIILLTL